MSPPARPLEGPQPYFALVQVPLPCLTQYQDAEPRIGFYDICLHKPKFEGNGPSRHVAHLQIGLV